MNAPPPRVQALAPAYLHRFQCLGSECEEHCCQGWRIDLDKATYQRYKTIPIRPLAEKVKASVSKLPSPSTRQYARIQLDDQGLCPLLNEDRLCGLQRELGSDYLSPTCRDFPRSYSRQGGALAAHASLACPESARLALLAPDAMEPRPMALDFANPSLVLLHSDKPLPAPDADPVRTHGELIHGALMAILQAPVLDTGSALALGGLLVRQMVRIAQSDASLEARRAEVAGLIARHLDPQVLADARRRHEALEAPLQPKIQLLREMARLFLNHAAPSTFKQTLAEAMAGLCAAGDSQEAVEAAYRQARELWVDPYDAAHPHVLRHYVMNHLALSQFPKCGALGLEDEYLHHGVRFAFLRFCLAGLAAHHRQTLSHEQVVQLVYRFSRRVEHNASFLPEIERAVRDAGFGSLGMLTLLLR